ncbi:MAG: arylsulfatase [Planctomycetota bacterium]|nr:MAG: arylsulfatase [Planctomycetota bacterium]
MNRREFLRAGAAISAGIAVGGCAGQLGAKRDGRANILYLMTDQQRGDCLGCAGNSVIRTPNIDAIAKEGAVFSNAYTSTPSCTPARSALLTGLSPWHHGMLGYGRVARRYDFELPRALREAGYYTFGIGKMHWYPERNLHGLHDALLYEARRAETPGFVSDYDKWFNKQAPGLDVRATGLGSNDYRAWAYALAEELHPTYWTGQMAVDFIERYDKGRPFLLKVSFHRPHSPYDPPERFMEMYTEDEMPEPYVGAWAKRFAAHKEPAPFNLWHGDLGLEQVRRSRRGYYGSVSFVDEQIGRIVAALKKRGMYDNTLIVFLADHGDMLGDHHHWRKTYAYEGSAKIPMVLRWPRGMGQEEARGTAIAEPVELRDILPTFLDAAGEEVPDRLDGMSLLRLVRPGKQQWREYIDLEHDVCYSVENHWNALTDGEYKYIYHAYEGVEQLFNLQEDPGEMRDLAGEGRCREVLKAWRNQMVEHFAERGEEFVREGRLLRRPERMLYSPFYPDISSGATRSEVSARLGW